MTTQQQSGATRQVLGALRDVLWYALPGGLFISMGVVSGRVSLAHVGELIAPYHPASWALGLLLIAACYLVGHLLAAIANLRADFWKLIHVNDPDWLAEYPTEVNARDVYLAHYFPDLFGDMDRRQRVAVLLWSSVAALLLGWLVFYIFHPAFADVAIGTAVLVFLDAVMMVSQLGWSRKAIHAAGLAIEEHEKAARDSEKAIQVTGDELRFMINAIFRAVELAKPRQNGQGQREPQAPEDQSSGDNQEPATAAPRFKSN